jgi:diguanylate cyclase (GGDEF)-like protein
LAACLLGLALLLSREAAAAADLSLQAQVLDPAAPESSASEIIGGSLDSRFKDFHYKETRKLGKPFWVKLTPSQNYNPPGGAAIKALKGRHLRVLLFVSQNGEAIPAPKATDISGYSGTHEAVFVVPNGLHVGQPLYAHVEINEKLDGAEVLRFEPAPLDETLAISNAHERVIALTFGALMAMSLASLLMWFSLSDRLFLLYGAQFILNGLYVAYLTGQGFDWPILLLALPFTSDAWNVPAALSGATASLFVREIADLKRFSPRAYRIFGVMAVVFVVLAAANFLKSLASVVVAAGNIIFIFSAIFTLLVAARSWRSGNRAAGWFLIAWGLLEGFTIATAARLLFTNTDHLIYYGLPFSMVAAAILVALGVADRLLEQRAALSEAEKRAQTDPLTGVLNRRSLIERLEAACLRARARGLPIALLFIDLDHFKEINDTYGHLAGDACLAAVIEPIQAELRQSDVIGRYGGEEFVVILSSADAAAAYPIAQRILERVANVSVNGYGKPIRLTCSIGVAASDTLGVWGEHLIARADEAVYAAKRSGRNRVQVAEQLAA